MINKLIEGLEKRYREIRLLNRCEQYRIEAGTLVRVIEEAKELEQKVRCENCKSRLGAGRCVIPDNKQIYSMDTYEGKSIFVDRNFYCKFWEEKE